MGDRIKELSAMAIAMPEGAELEAIMEELRAALSEQSRRARKRLAGDPDQPKNRITD